MNLLFFVILLIIIVLVVITIILILSNGSKCVQNFAANLGISNDSAKCLYKQFKKQRVPQNIINELCKPLTKEGLDSILKNLSIDTIKKMSDASKNCNIPIIFPMI